ncbi:MAG: AAA family ATPase [Paraburkholderia sp.]
MKNTFVAGIHAVGKSYLCGRAAASGWVHSSASTLIKQELGGANWTGAKLVDDPDRNQKALIAAVQRINADGQRLLLDGHFVLRDASDKFVFLGADVFADRNQKALIAAVQRINADGQRLLLDGHFVLRDASDKFVFLGADVFADLNLAAVVLIEASASLIAERLQSRDGVARRVSDIEEFQLAERQQAETVCAALMLELTVLNAPTDEQFLAALGNS